MHYDDVIGLDHIKNHLQQTVSNRRIAHAQLFSGPYGSGLLPLAIAYARQIICLQDPERSNSQIDKLAHPDLIFSFPMAPIGNIKKPVSDDFIPEWREFVSASPYAGLYEWHKKIGIEKKQGLINVREAQHIISQFSLKSYQGGYRVVIIYGADKLNTEASNKLLKLIEEPPEQSVFLLLTEDEDNIIGTIRSRCQLLQIPRLPQTVIADALVDQNVSRESALRLSRQANGSFFKALQLASQNEDVELFEKCFIKWMRLAFQVRSNPTIVKGLMALADDLAGLGRETQKQFLDYCCEFCRQAMLSHYHADSLVYVDPREPSFTLKKFAAFIDGHNIESLHSAFEDAAYHVERNANPKAVFSDLSMQVTRMLNRKQ